MASVWQAKNGSWKIQFTAPGDNGKRPTITLGKVNERIARSVHNLVESLEAAAKTGETLDTSTLQRVARLPDSIRDKLADVGLLKRRSRITLGAFLDDYIDGLAGKKPRTLENHRVTAQYLIRHFGSDKLLAEITRGDADRWRESLLRKGLAKKTGLAPATVAREVKRAKQFFEAAARHELIHRNPFTHLKGGKQENRSRFYFVSLDDAKKVLDACPDAEWRVIFALARFGGLRVPIDLKNLRWEDIFWDQDRFRVYSEKLEHIEGKAERIVPIFPELRPFLEGAFEQAEEGAVYVAPRCRDPKINLRTQMNRIIRKAGLVPWEKTFVNLRSTRQTELLDQGHAIQAVCEWIGNSEAVAAAHYLQVTEEHYQKALTAPSMLEQHTPEEGADWISSALQNRVQTSTDGPERGLPQKRDTLKLSEKDRGCRVVASVKVPPRGVEPRLSD